MNKWLLLLLLFSVFTITSCGQEANPMVRVEDINCVQMGFIPVDEVNELVSINNKLITLVNACYEGTGVEPLPYIKEYTVSGT